MWCAGGGIPGGTLLILKLLRGGSAKRPGLKDHPLLPPPIFPGLLLTSTATVAAGPRAVPGPGVSGHTCLRDSGLEGEPTGSVAWPRSSAGEGQHHELGPWSGSIQHLPLPHLVVPSCFLLTISTVAAPHHPEDQLPALGAQIPAAKRSRGRNGEVSKGSPPLN